MDNCSAKRFFWTGTPTEFVEWAYGMLETNRINDGDLEIEEFVEDLAMIFSIEIKDCYNTFRAIRRRTGSRTAFLDEMIEKLEKRMDDMDNGIFKKKRKK